MTPWIQALRAAVVSGTLASACSILVLAWRGRTDAQAVAAPLNAPSHWLWRRALWQNEASLRYTLTGVLVHQAASLFWALLYERMAPRHAPRDPLTAVRDAAAVTVVAAVVDLKLVPPRLTPGFEHRLKPRSLTGVYLAFGAGLALAGVLASRGKPR